jgi:hypothetical protein
MTDAAPPTPAASTATPPAPAVTVKYTKTFKKYTDEFEAPVVDYVRSWARAEPLMAFHEDNSIVKVTGTDLHIKTLLATLKSRFHYVPPEDCA